MEWVSLVGVVCFAAGVAVGAWALDLDRVSGRWRLRRRRRVAPRARAVYGSPGGRLEAGVQFADGNAWTSAWGVRGEQLTAKVTDRRAAEIGDGGQPAGGLVVFHDLATPGHHSANIDHVLVCGRAVMVLDSKCWASGLYWTARGTTRRGLRHAAHADKSGVGWEARQLERWLAEHGVSVQLVTPRVVVWPARSRGVSVRWYRPRDARVLPGRALYRELRRFARHEDSIPLDLLTHLCRLCGTRDPRAHRAAVGAGERDAPAAPSDGRSHLGRRERGDGKVARYDSMCPACHEPITAGGDRIVRDPRGYVHEGCEP